MLGLRDPVGSRHGASLRVLRQVSGHHAGSQSAQTHCRRCNQGAQTGSLLPRLALEPQAGPGEGTSESGLGDTSGSGVGPVLAQGAPHTWAIKSLHFHRGQRESVWCCLSGGVPRFVGRGRGNSTCVVILVTGREPRQCWQLTQLRGPTTGQPSPHTPRGWPAHSGSSSSSTAWKLTRQNSAQPAPASKSPREQVTHPLPPWQAVSDVDLPQYRPGSPQGSPLGDR